MIRARPISTPLRITSTRWSAELIRIETGPWGAFSGSRRNSSSTASRSALTGRPVFASTGEKAELAKRIKALIGSKGGKADYDYGFNLSSGTRVEGKTPVKSVFERQRDMLESARVTGRGSPTGTVTDAIDNQGRDQRRVEMLVGALRAPAEVPWKIAASIAQRITQPKIYDPAVSAELGRMLSTRGRDELIELINVYGSEQMSRDSLREIVNRFFETKK
jgi:hypothetical protein